MTHNPLTKEALAGLRLAAEKVLTFPDYCHPIWQRRKSQADDILCLLATIAARDKRIESLETTLSGLLEHIHHNKKLMPKAIVVQYAQAVLDEPQKEKRKELLKSYMALPYRIEIYPDGTGFTATIPELSGCTTCSTVFEDLWALIEEAKELWLETALLDGDYIPVPTEVQCSKS